MVEINSFTPATNALPSSRPIAAPLFGNLAKVLSADSFTVLSGNIQKTSLQFSATHPDGELAFLRTQAKQNLAGLLAAMKDSDDPKARALLAEQWLSSLGLPVDSEAYEEFLTMTQRPVTQEAVLEWLTSLEADTLFGDEIPVKFGGGDALVATRDWEERRLRGS